MKILIIEDDAIQALSLEMIIKKTGIKKIKKVHHASEALDVIAQYKPDLMFVDINLSSSISGIDIVKKAQEESEISVVYITGNSDSTYRKKAEQTQFIDFLIKPVHPKVLENLIAKEMSLN